MRERPDVRIDCPSRMADWTIHHVFKAEACLNYLDEGTQPLWRANVFFREVRDDLLAHIEHPNDDTPNALWFRWTKDELEHALACYAYIRHGLNYWQRNNLYWIDVAIYLSGRLVNQQDFDAGRTPEILQDPLPESDSSPAGRSKR